MTNLTSNRSWDQWVGSDHYYSLNADDKPGIKQKLESMSGKWSLLFSDRQWPTWLPTKAGSMGGKRSLVFSERRWPTWLPTEAGVDVWEGIISILWTQTTNPTSNRSWGRWVESVHYYSLNADDQPYFQQKIGSMCGKWSLLFSEPRWPTWLQTEAGVNGWEVIITILLTPMSTWLPTEARVNGWEVIITILLTPMTNPTSNRSWGRRVGRDHYYSLNADDQPDFQQKMGSMCGKWSLLFSERRWTTWLPLEAGVDVWEVILTILWTPMTNLTSNGRWGRCLGSDHYYYLNADDQPDFQQKIGSMCGKWSLLFSERWWPTWLPTEAEVNRWEEIISILWTSMTNLTSNRSWGQRVGRDHY